MMEAMEYKLNTEIGQRVYLVEIGIRTEADIPKRMDMYKHGITITELYIAYQSKYQIALSDDFITRLARQQEGRRKDSYNTYFEDVMVTIKTKEDYFPNGIFGSCYTLEKPQKAINRIKKDMIKKINDEYGFLRFTDIENTIAGFDIPTFENNKK